MKTILKNSFYYLLAIYSVLVLLIAMGIFSKYSIQFHILALIIGLLGITLLWNTKDKVFKSKTKKNLQYTLLTIGILLVIFIRIIPFIGNSIPLGYDAGIYKYGILLVIC